MNLELLFMYVVTFVNDSELVTFDEFIGLFKFLAFYTPLRLDVLGDHRA